MLITWLMDHRRKKILETPFPDSWRSILQNNLGHYSRLNTEEQQRLRDLLQVFVAEKNWEGCGGLALNDEIKVTVAGGACLLVLNLPHDFYRNVNSILIYPSTMLLPEEPVGVFDRPRDPGRGPLPILGEAQMNGPVILAWDNALRTSRHPETGHNVVYHEFSHKLDMLSGQPDGTPPLHGAEEYRQWAEVFSKVFLDLKEKSSKGKKPSSIPMAPRTKRNFLRW